jgi:hypothetical protein
MYHFHRRRDEFRPHIHRPLLAQGIMRDCPFAATAAAAAAVAAAINRILAASVFAFADCLFSLLPFASPSAGSPRSPVLVLLKPSDRCDPSNERVRLSRSLTGEPVIQVPPRPAFLCNLRGTQPKVVDQLAVKAVNNKYAYVRITLTKKQIQNTQYQ